MTPKEKAEELVSRFIIHTNLFNPDNPYNNGWEKAIDSAKQCALIAVEETINTLNYDIRDLDVRGSVLLDLITYWREVKSEIEKL